MLKIIGALIVGAAAVSYFPELGDTVRSYTNSAAQQVERATQPSTEAKIKELIESTVDKVSE